MRRLARRKNIFIIISFLVLAVVLLTPAPEGLTQQGQRALAVFALAVVLWVSGALPLMVTSILALALLALLQVLPQGEVYALFGNEPVFFILGAFILASGLVRSGLSSRIALVVLKRFGRTPRSLVAATLLLPAVLSLVISEHAVAAMLFPIVLEIVTALSLIPGESTYGKSLFLAMAWGAIIGGIVTFLGGARAPLAVAILQSSADMRIGFTQWAAAAFPIALVELLIAFGVLSVLFRGELTSVAKAQSELARKCEALGPMTKREKAFAVLMAATVALWATIGTTVGIANIALLSVTAAFAAGLLKWQEVEEDVNWGVVLMYGGAIALGLAMNESGASAWLAKSILGGGEIYGLLLVAGLAVTAVVLTEMISNSAVVALLLPVALGIAAQSGLDPRVATLAVAIPSGLAFSLPMGTPATAIAYSSGFVGVRDTVRGGLILNMAAIPIFLLVAWLWWPIVGFSF